MITDDHFEQRDRMGRLMAFLARQIQDGQATTALGLAASEVTSVVVDKNGLATVFGDGPAYFVHATHAPESCAPKTPLTYSSFLVCRVTSGGTYDLRTRPTSGCYPISVTAGVLDGNPY